MAEIQLDKLTKIYSDGTQAVTEFDLDVSDGEFVVFVGPSGCGKTTALRMIAGLEPITDGTVRIGGEVVNTLPPSLVVSTIWVRLWPLPCTHSILRVAGSIRPTTFDPSAEK